MPACIGALLAYREAGVFPFATVIVVLVCIWALHLGGNLLNEYYDWISGADRINEVITPFSGGTRMLVENRLSPGVTCFTAYGLLILGLSGFAGISYFTHPGLFWFGLFGFVSPILYSAKPFWLAYRGFGELLLGFTFGPMVAATVCYSVMAATPVDVWILGFSVGFLASAVLTINEFPDIEADRKVGKMNLVARLGPRGGFVVYAGLLLLGTGGPWICVALGLFPTVYLLLAAPFAFALYIAWRGRKNYEKLENLIGTCRRTIQVFMASCLLIILATALDIWLL